MSILDEVFEDENVYGFMSEDCDAATMAGEDIADAEISAVLADDDEEDEILAILGDLVPENNDL